MPEPKIKQSVRNFYDEVGWQQVGEGVYQNAQYEDLRPVSRDYIHNCHLRINRFIGHQGKYLLDAGSGPIQYPEYLTYSEGYQYRVCLDISVVALHEARKRIGSQGLFVVGDIANLPFMKGAFADIVSLHAIHHLPRQDYGKAYRELKRVLQNDGRAVIVNGWESSPLMELAAFPMRIMERLLPQDTEEVAEGLSGDGFSMVTEKPESTFVHKLDAGELLKLLGSDFPVQIQVWRSISVRFLRAMIHPFLFGRLWLKILFWAEELFPNFFGEIGQYPLITFAKSHNEKTK